MCLLIITWRTPYSTQHLSRPQSRFRLSGSTAIVTGLHSSVTRIVNIINGDHYNSLLLSQLVRSINSLIVWQYISRVIMPNICHGILFTALYHNFCPQINVCFHAFHSSILRRKILHACQLNSEVSCMQMQQFTIVCCVCMTM